MNKEQKQILKEFTEYLKDDLYNSMENDGANLNDSEQLDECLDSAIKQFTKTKGK